MPGNHVRLSSAKLGDDTSFSRYVKIRSKPPQIEGRVRQIKMAIANHPAVEEERTYFPKSVRSPRDMKMLLVSGRDNVKIGADVRKGKLRGYKIFTLSLQERATCPTSCQHFRTCYGNNMPYAKRIDHTHPDFLRLLDRDIEFLMSRRHMDRTPWPGVLIRLHALGDFYSPEYVRFWELALDAHPRLAVYGYTARMPGTPIGDAVQRMVKAYGSRAMIRVSDGRMETGSTVSILNASQCPDNAFICPEQTGKVDACGKCGACWSGFKNVAFLEH